MLAVAVQVPTALLVDPAAKVGTVLGRQGAGRDHHVLAVGYLSTRRAPANSGRSCASGTYRTRSPVPGAETAALLDTTSWTWPPPSVKSRSPGPSRAKPTGRPTRSWSKLERGSFSPIER